jgi:cupin fold WbuC family metalloprotein
VTFEADVARRMRPAGPDVFYWTERVLRVGPEVVNFLKSEAGRSERKRSRLCAHTSVEADVHEMLIVHHRDVYVRPHRHVAKPESFHLIEGEALVVLFYDDGRVRDLLELSSSQNASFYFRIAPATYHAFIIRSEWLVFHETTAGPFERAEMEFAPWSPAEDDCEAIERFKRRFETEARRQLDPA